MQQPQYINIDIVKYVKDYEYLFKTHCKRRWVGQNIFDFFCSEFIQYTSEYYKDAIIQGKIQINSKTQNLDYKLKDNDVITHLTIRREPPVFNLPLKTIFENEDILVINKPPSIPVHPCGQFHYNSIIEILEHEYKKGKLYPAHRIDKMTSGVLILSKQPKHTLGVEEKNKTYLARVQGEFKFDEHICETPIYCVSAKKSEYDVYNKNNHNEKNDKDFKEAKTIFKKLWYDLWSNSTLLECKPITGRTHQIRVHLKYLGHPIINDICYGGPNIGNVILRDYCEKNEIYGKTYKKKMKDLEGNEKVIFCYKNIIPDSFQWTLSDEHAMEIYLHSYKYELGDKIFESEKPYWADQTFNFRLIQHLQM